MERGGRVDMGMGLGVWCLVRVAVAMEVGGNGVKATHLHAGT